jgi:hypothetical protein
MRSSDLCLVARKGQFKIEQTGRGDIIVEEVAKILNKISLASNTAAKLARCNTQFFLQTNTDSKF